MGPATLKLKTFVILFLIINGHPISTATSRPMNSKLVALAVVNARSRYEAYLTSSSKFEVIIHL
jgi:hypothetical protein